MVHCVFINNLKPPFFKKKRKKNEKKEDATRTPARWFKRICIAKRPLVEAKTSSFLPTSLSREQLKLQ